MTIHWLQKVCADLRLHFNKLFDEMYIKKQREMSLLVERNERLRTILSELEITCHGEKHFILLLLVFNFPYIKNM